MEKLFSSTMCYQVALALYGGFERIEIFGVELVMEAMAFWMGKADGMGIEVWLPEPCALLVQPLYAYEEIRKESGQIVWSSEGIIDANNEPIED